MVGRFTLAAASVVDLSHTLTPEFPMFPVYDPVEVAQRCTLATHGFNAKRWSFDEHCGTHVDAPAHFGGEATVDQLEPHRLVLPVAVIDIRDRVARDDDAIVTPDDLLRWERRHGRLPDGSAVFALSGWGTRAGSSAAYLNADAAGVMHFPSFGAEAADWLREERPAVEAIGVDVSSLDIGASTEYPVHSRWLRSGRFGIENLARLELLPHAGAVVVVGAPPLSTGTAAPARILALVP